MSNDTKVFFSVISGFAIIILPLIIAACISHTNSPKYLYDVNLERKVFYECLKSVPKGPQSTVMNDWDEVVKECRRAAFYYSRKCIKNCEY